MNIKKLPWKIQDNVMVAKPFVFTKANGEKIIPKFPFYSLQSKMIDGEEMYSGVFWYGVNGCDIIGVYTRTGDYTTMEAAKEDCQHHFEDFFKSCVNE